MALRVLPGIAEHERLAEQQLHVVVRPALRRQRLQEHDDALRHDEHSAKTTPPKGCLPGSPSLAASCSTGRGKPNKRTGEIAKKHQVPRPTVIDNREQS